MSRPPAPALAGAAVAVVLAGCAGPGGQPAAVASASVAPAPAGDAGSAAARRPVQLRVPAIGVDTPLVDLGVDAAGALVPPATADVAGWFGAGPAPGDAGPALLAGHVDSRSGPGVFFRLRDLVPGDRIEVTRADGRVEAFAVSRLVQTPKTAFPTDLVYAPTPGPELRLVTCGGAFDRTVRSYRDNIVVEAVPAGDSQWRIG